MALKVHTPNLVMWLIFLSSWKIIRAISGHNCKTFLEGKLRIEAVEKVLFSSNISAKHHLAVFQHHFIILMIGISYLVCHGKCNLF